MQRFKPRWLTPLAMSVGALLLSLGWAQGGGADPVVLSVDQTNFTLSEFDDRFDFYVANLASQQGLPLNDETRGLFDELRPAYLDRLAREEVVLQLGRSRGLSVDAAEVDERVAAIRANFDSDEAFREALLQAGVGSENLLRTLIGEAELSNLTIAVLEQAVELPDYYVQLFYDANRSVLERPAETCARHILVDTEAEALSLKAELDTGASFETLARENSTDTGSGAQGGDLGCFSPGRMVPEFETAAFTTPVGTVSAPVQSQFGYHLVLPYERTEASVVPLADVESDIRAELARQVVRKVVESYLENATVEKFEDRLAPADGG